MTKSIVQVSEFSLEGLGKDRTMRTVTLFFSLILVGSGAAAQEYGGASDAGLAQQLSNPVSSLISVPFQFNYNSGFGPADGDRVFALRSADS